MLRIWFTMARCQKVKKADLQCFENLIHNAKCQKVKKADSDILRIWSTIAICQKVTKADSNILTIFEWSPMLQGNFNYIHSVFLYFIDSIYGIMARRASERQCSQPVHTCFSFLSSFVCCIGISSIRGRRGLMTCLTPLLFRFRHDCCPCSGYLAWFNARQLKHSKSQLWDLLKDCDYRFVSVLSFYITVWRTVYNGGLFVQRSWWAVLWFFSCRFSCLY